MSFAGIPEGVGISTLSLTLTSIEGVVLLMPFSVDDVPTSMKEQYSLVSLVALVEQKTNTSTEEADTPVVATEADVDDDSTIWVAHDVVSCVSSAEMTAVSSKGRKTPMFLRRNILADQQHHQ